STGTAGCTREKKSSRRDSNMGGDARRTSVLLVSRRRISFTQATPRCYYPAWACGSADGPLANAVALALARAVAAGVVAGGGGRGGLARRLAGSGLVLLAGGGLGLLAGAGLGPLARGRGPLHRP